MHCAPPGHIGVHPTGHVGLCLARAVRSHCCRPPPAHYCRACCISIRPSGHPLPPSRASFGGYHGTEIPQWHAELKCEQAEGWGCKGLARIPYVLPSHHQHTKPRGDRWASPPGRERGPGPCCWESILLGAVTPWPGLEALSMWLLFQPGAFPPTPRTPNLCAGLSAETSKTAGGPSETRGAGCCTRPCREAANPQQYPQHTSVQSQRALGLESSR